MILRLFELTNNRKALKDNNQVILISHLGRPENKRIELSLAPVAKYLSQKLKPYKLFL